MTSCRVASACSTRPDPPRRLCAHRHRRQLRGRPSAASGALDPTLDGDGMLTTAIGTFSQAEAIAVDANGRFVVAGSARFGGSDDLALARYNADGSLDRLRRPGSHDSYRRVGIRRVPGRPAERRQGRRRRYGAAGSERDFALIRVLVDDCGNGSSTSASLRRRRADRGRLLHHRVHVPAGRTLCRASPTTAIRGILRGSSGACPVDLRKPDADGDGVCDEHDSARPSPIRSSSTATATAWATPATPAPTASRSASRSSRSPTSRPAPATTRSPSPASWTSRLRRAGPDRQGARLIVEDGAGSSCSTSPFRPAPTAR